MEDDKRSTAFFEKAKAALARNASTFEYNKVRAPLPDEARMMNRLADATNAFFAILDPISLEYVHVTPNVFELTGYSTEHWCNNGFRKLLSLIHPDEGDAIINFHEVGMSIFRNARIEERPDFRMIMDFRMLGDDGQYRKFVRITSPFSIDSEGNILAWLNCYRDITHLKGNQSICFMVREEREYTRMFRYQLKEKEVLRVAPLTRREREVLECLALGQDTRQIADALSLTATTVNQHRRKLVEKTATHSSECMVTYLSMVGLLRRRKEL